MLTDEVDEDRNGLVVRRNPQIKPGQRSARVRISFADRVRDCLFEMLDRIRDVGVGPALRRPRTAINLRRGDEAEHAVRFRIGPRDFQRLLRRADGVVDLVVPKIYPASSAGISAASGSSSIAFL